MASQARKEWQDVKRKVPGISRMPVRLRLGPLLDEQTKDLVTLGRKLREVNLLLSRVVERRGKIKDALVSYSKQASVLPGRSRDLVQSTLFNIRRWNNNVTTSNPDTAKELKALVQKLQLLQRTR